MARYQDVYLGWQSLPRELLDRELEYLRLTDEDITGILDAGFHKRFHIAIGLQLAFTRLTGGRIERLDLVPKALLAQLAGQFGVPAPRIASLKAIYRRRQSQYPHQIWIMKRLGMEKHGRKHELQLMQFLQDACRGTSSVDRLLETSFKWFYDKKLLIPAESTVRDLAVRAMKDSDQWIYRRIRDQVSEKKTTEWFRLLMEPREEKGSTLGWLQEPPGKKDEDSFKEINAKIHYLESIGVAELDLSKIPQERVEIYHRTLLNLRPAHLRAMPDPNRTVHIACFLRTALGRLKDVVIKQVADTTTQVYSKAMEKVRDNQPKTIAHFRTVIKSFVELIANGDLRSPEVQKQLKELALAQDVEGVASRAEEVRVIIASGSDGRPRKLLRTLMELKVRGADGDPAIANLEKLRGLYTKKKYELPKKPLVVPGIWNKYVNEEQDREKAMHAFEFHTLSEVRRKLRAGACWIDSSSDHRNPDEMLISPELWAQTRKGHYDRLRLPLNSEDYLEPIIKLASERVMEVAEKVKTGEIKIENGRLKFPRVEQAHPLAGKQKIAKDAVIKEIPEAQLPEVLLFVDSKTHFSSKLLGRPAHTEHELKLCYGAMLALGTDMEAKGVAMMIPGLTEEQVGNFMRTIQRENALAKANDAVLSLYNKLPITEFWGDGSSAGADMMSLQTSRHLWNSRRDYKRQTASIGIYDHVSSNLSYAYSQPFVLNNRQVGAAIQGVVSQPELEILRVAVDTHGYTDVGMGFAKPLGFDICPRIRNMKNLALTMPRGFEAPEVLKDVVVCGVSVGVIHEKWDEFVRVVASIGNATCSAVTVLERFGSAARGNRTYLAAKHLGRLQRTIFLCDYLLNEEFRKEISRLLTQVENSHKLKRVIYFGQMAHDRGRDKDELFSISQALNLIANIIQYWHAVHIQEGVITVEKRGLEVARNVKASISSSRTGSINMRGRFEFPFGKYAGLLRPETGRVRAFR